MDGIVRVRTIAFTPDRTPMMRRIRLGYEGDNLVERLEFDLPEIVQGQTATLMITGADAVTLKRTDEGRYAVDLTRDMIGPDGEREAYVRIDGVGGEVWQSAVMRMVTGALPDVEEEIEKQYPTAVAQMLTAMAEHSGEMQAQEERVEQAAQRAEDAADRAEAGGGGSGSGAPGADGGYYQPSVTDGVLSWTPSKANMPSVPASDVRGPAGQDGQPGKDGADGAPGAPGKTAYQYAQDGGYTGTEAEFAEKLAQEIPEPYTLPVATADRLGGVRVGSDFVMDGETLAIANGLTLFDSVEVQEGVEIKSFRWTKEAPVKEYQIFCYFPIASTAQRVSGQCGDVLWYMPQGLMTDAARYGWVKCENRTNSFPVVGYYGAKEGYSTNVPTLGDRFQPSHRTDMFIEILALIPFPVGTTVKVYVR